MAQVRRPRRYRSPPARQIPALPNPIRVRPVTQNKKRLFPAASQSDFNNSEIQERQGSPSELNPPTQITEESLILPPLNDDTESLLDKKHLPVFAKFPFDVSFLPQPMETNLEDNVHKLRLRLIDSELNHQRRSTDEYIKRTRNVYSPIFRKEISLSPSAYYVHHARPPSVLVHQQIVPKILSRQTSLSKLSFATSSSDGLSIDRIGMENDVQDDIERELEIRRIQESLHKRRRANQQLILSNYNYDPRAHLQPVDEDHLYTSTNMDDLIDSMARRHLAYRRLDAAIDRQRRTSGSHDPHSSRSRTQRDSVRRNSNNFHQMLRSRIDYYNRIQPDLDGDDSITTNSYTKLPPISPGYDSSRFNHLQNPSTSTLYDSHVHKPAFPEHLIDLPSDIFLDTLNSSQRSRKTRQRSISKDNRPDIGNENHHGKNSQNGHHGIFTERNDQQKKKTKYRRNIFKKTAIGILFFITLKHRAIKKRSQHSIQSPIATIHKIRLQEIVVGLHRVYLEPDGPIYNALLQAINNPISLKDALNTSSKNYSEAIKIIGNALKNVVSKIIEFMPKDGVLGTSKTSAVSALIQDGNPFPENYFWQCERKLLEFDQLKVINITKQRAILLLIGIFIFRALVTTLLIKPIKYRLILGQLQPKQTVNLKILASVILYLGRRTAGPKSHILTVPDEWQLSLHTDGVIEPIIQHSEIKSIINSCEESLRVWCEEYIHRIDESFGKKLRI